VANGPSVPVNPEWVQAIVERMSAMYRAATLKAAQANAAPPPLPVLSERALCAVPCWPGGPPCEVPADQLHKVHVAPADITRNPDAAFDGFIPSNTDPNVRYHVVVYNDSRPADCDCKGHQFRRWQDCSHIKMVKEAIDTTHTL